MGFLNQLIHKQVGEILTIVTDIQTRVKALEQKADAIMSDQSHLDAEAAQVVTQNAAILAAVDAIKAQPGAAALDFSALDAAVTGEAADVTAVEGLETPAPPAPPA